MWLEWVLHPKLTRKFLLGIVAVDLAKVMDGQPILIVG
jgi:hypothetical protein